LNGSYAARFACHFPLQSPKNIGSQSEAGNQIGMYCTQKNKKRRRTFIQLKFSASGHKCQLFSKVPKVHGRAFFSVELSMFTPQRHIAETGNEQHYQIITSDRILRNEIDRYYNYWRSLKINLLGNGMHCCYLLVTTNFPTTFLVIHNWIRHRYCKKIPAKTSNNKIISIIQTKGSFIIIERSAFLFLIVYFIDTPHFEN